MTSLINKIFPVIEETQEIQLAAVNMDMIRYANCWEDADLLLDGLGNQKGNSILSIASGGDNSFSLLTTDAKKVVAIDINEVQLFLVELKKEAIRTFSHSEYLRFIGFANGKDRSEMYHTIREQLSEGAKAYWDNQQDKIESGLVHNGKFENYLSAFCKYILPLIHSKETVRQLLSPKSAEDQAAFMEKHWNTWRWRFLFKIFFSRFVLGTFGRDPSFLKEVDIKVSSFLLDRANTYLSTEACQNNWMLKFILQGTFEKQLPHYVQKKNFEHIKQNLDRLVLEKGLVEDAIQKHGTFDAFNLSNIFEYMDTVTFSIVGNQLLKGSTAQTKFAYWNLMVPRRLSDLFQKQLKINAPGKLIDRGFFYRDFIVDQREVLPSIPIWKRIESAVVQS